VPVIEDPKLAHLLSKVPLGEEIPVELYQAIAEILVFILRLEMTIDDHA
jgi:flagellar biosynthesis protein